MKTACPHLFSTRAPQARTNFSRKSLSRKGALGTILSGRAMLVSSTFQTFMTLQNIRPVLYHRVPSSWRSSRAGSSLLTSSSGETGRRLPGLGQMSLKGLAPGRRTAGFPSLSLRRRMAFQVTKARSLMPLSLAWLYRLI